MNSLAKRLAALEARRRSRIAPDIQREPITLEIAQRIAAILIEAGGDELLNDVLDAQTERLEK